MQKKTTLSSVNEMISQAVIVPGAHEALSEEEKNAVLKEADDLPLHWLMSAYKKTKKFSLVCMVQLAQNTTVYLLNKLYDDTSESPSGFRAALEYSLNRFIYYLQSGFRNHFDFNGPMPKNLWEPLRLVIMEALLPGENCSLQETDEALTELIHGQYLASAGAHMPSFAKGYYWEHLVTAFRHTRPFNDPTLRTIYTLVSCNFNHPAFAKYVVDYYGKDLPLNTDTTDFWTEHMFQVKRIIEIPEVALEPKLPHCKKMLFTEMSQEIQAYVYTNNAKELITATEHFKTNLNIAQLALFYRLQVDVNIVDGKNKTALLQLVSQLYQIPGDNLNHEQLYDKYYKIDPGTIKSVQTYVVAMLNLLRGMGK